MQDEQTNKTDTDGTNDNKVVPTSEKPLSIVDEAKKVRDEIKAENDRREEILKQEQKLRSESLLGGTSGGHVDPVVKEETAQEYKDRIMRGKA